MCLSCGKLAGRSKHKLVEHCNEQVDHVQLLVYPRYEIIVQGLDVAIASHQLDD